MSENVKRERFLRIAESRVNKVLESLDNLAKCSNKRNYEYTDDEVRKIFREIERKVREVKSQYQGTTGNTQKFRL
ncbi:MAG: hypothetical protein JW712_04335 [Dehalococcoidales bacterium]|nr:hypothetical protein [Dehalococcoidales bacterium]